MSMVILSVCVFSLYLTDIFGCQACPPGHFCGTDGLSHPSGLCQAGFYCLGGDTKATGKKQKTIKPDLFLVFSK